MFFYQIWTTVTTGCATSCHRNWGGAVRRNFV